MATSIRQTKSSAAGSMYVSRRDGTGEPEPAFNGPSKGNKGKNSHRGRSGRRDAGKLAGQANSSPLHKPDTTAATTATKLANPRAKVEVQRLPGGQNSLSPSSVTSSPNPRHTSVTSTSQISGHNPDPRSRLSQSQPSRLEEVPKSPNSFDVKSNIDALVERVRASAMGTNRPHSPGSHIDWAGHDDDSLPDLDDWGIGSPTLINSHNAISPIMVDGLVSLPECATAPSLVESRDDSLIKTSTEGSILQDGPPKAELKEPDRPVSSDAVGEPSTANAGQLGTGPESMNQSPLHSTLPPKPVNLIQQDGKHCDNPSLSKRHQRPRIRNAKTRDHKTTAAGPSNPPSKFEDRYRDQLEILDSSENWKGLAASIHAPGSLNEPKTSNHRNGASGRVHHKTTMPRNNFNMFKGDTTGLHPHGVNYFSSFSQPARQQAHFRIDPQPDRLTENRSHVQSSPGANSSSRVSHSRPVLTGGALTQLAKTIGAASSTKPLPTPHPTE